MSASPAPPARRTRFAAVLGAGFAALVLWLQAFVVGVTEHGLTAPADQTLTQAYTVALAQGHPHLERTPDPRLLALSNPYDPALNAGLGPLDVSYYRGKFYLYFGIVPWAVLLVPWFKLTGSHLSESGALWIFCGAGFLCQAIALWEIWRRWFATVSPFLLLAGWATVAVGSGAWALLAIPQLTQIPSAAGYAGCGLAMLSLVCAETRPAFQLRWLAVAMLAAGLIMGCRPNYLPVVTIMVAWTVFRVSRRSDVNLARITAVLFPIAAVAALLGGWNFLRFGHPLEFGFKYQLIALNRAAGEGEMSWSHLAFNLHRYLVGGARWIEYFPFVAGEAPGPFPLPAGHDETDQVYGLLWVTPIVALAPIGLLLGARPVRFLAGLIAACGLGNLLLLGAFGGGAYRYPVDFMALFTVTAAVGFLQLGSLPRPIKRGLTVGLGLGLLARSATTQLWQLVSFYDLFERNHPTAFRALARPFNALVYFKQGLTNGGPRALRLTLQFPSDRTGQIEPLVVVGPKARQDFLYVYYFAPDQIQFGFESMGRGGPLTRSVPIDFTRPHSVELRYGSFQPPDDHPAWRHLPAEDRALARRTLTVLLDDQPVLDGWSDFHPTRGSIKIGESPDDAAFGRRFTGKIERIESPPLPTLSPPERWHSSHYGPLRLGLTLRPAPTGAREPLVSFGHRNQGALLVLERLTSNQIRLGYFSTRDAAVWSSPIPWTNDETKILTIEAGALFPPETSPLWKNFASLADRAATKRHLKLQLEGLTVWSTDVPALDVSPTTVAVGRNDLLLAGIAPTLAAEIITTERLSTPALRAESAGAP